MDSESGFLDSSQCQATKPQWVAAARPLRGGLAVIFPQVLSLIVVLAVLSVVLRHMGTTTVPGEPLLLCLVQVGAISGYGFMFMKRHSIKQALQQTIKDRPRPYLYLASSAGLTIGCSTFLIHGAASGGSGLDTVHWLVVLLVCGITVATCSALLSWSELRGRAEAKSGTGRHRAEQPNIYRALLGLVVAVTALSVFAVSLNPELPMEAFASGLRSLGERHELWTAIVGCAAAMAFLAVLRTEFVQLLQPVRAGGAGVTTSSQPPPEQEKLELEALYFWAFLPATLGFLSLLVLHFVVAWSDRWTLAELKHGLGMSLFVKSLSVLVGTFWAVHLLVDVVRRESVAYLARVLLAVPFGAYVLASVVGVTLAPFDLKAVTVSLVALLIMAWPENAVGERRNWLAIWKGDVDHIAPSVLVQFFKGTGLLIFVVSPLLVDPPGRIPQLLTTSLQAMQAGGDVSPVPSARATSMDKGGTSSSGATGRAPAAAGEPLSPVTWPTRVRSPWPTGLDGRAVGHSNLGVPRWSSSLPPWNRASPIPPESVHPLLRSSWTSRVPSLPPSETVEVAPIGSRHVVRQSNLVAGPERSQLPFWVRRNVQEAQEQAAKERAKERAKAEVDQLIAQVMRTWAEEQGRKAQEEDPHATAAAARLMADRAQVEESAKAARDKEARDKDARDKARDAALTQLVVLMILIWLCRDVLTLSELVQYVNTIAAQRARDQEAYAREQNLATVAEHARGLAHDLRRGFTMAITLARKVRDGQNDPQEFEELCKLADTTRRYAILGQSLSQALLDQAQDPGATDSKGPTVLPDRVDLDEFFNEAQGFLLACVRGLETASFRCRFEPSQDGEVVKFRLDEHTMLLVLYNMTSNSVNEWLDDPRHQIETGDGGSRPNHESLHDLAVSITGKLLAEGTLEITVKDNGRGFDSDFDLAEVRRSKWGGSGIGLRNCQRYITAHGGTLEIGDGSSGATLIIKIPSPVRQSARAPAIPGSPDPRP